VEQVGQLVGFVMSILNRLASALDRSDEVPNQILASEIAEAGNKDAVRELTANLSNADKNIQHDCIKVLYEVGYLKPELIAPHVDTFIQLLRSRNNRLVWGGMTALGSIADLTAVDIWKQIDVVMNVTDRGSVITQDWGIRVLAAVSAKEASYEKRIFPFLKGFLQKCPAKDFPRHLESCLVAINSGNSTEIMPIIEARKLSLKPAQSQRVEKLLRKLITL
jgi:hypothetical protein